MSGVKNSIYFRFGYDFDKKHDKAGLMDIVEEFGIACESGKKPYLLVQVERFFAEAREEEDKNPTEHLRPHFRAANWLVPQLRQILAFYNFPYPPRASKTELVDVFEARREEILLWHGIIPAYVYDPAVDLELSQGMSASSLGGRSEMASSSGHRPYAPRRDAPTNRRSPVLSRPRAAGHSFQTSASGNGVGAAHPDPTSQPSSRADDVASFGSNHSFGQPTTIGGTTSFAGNKFNQGNASTGGNAPNHLYAFAQGNTATQDGSHNEAAPPHSHPARPSPHPSHNQYNSLQAHIQTDVRQAYENREHTPAQVDDALQYEIEQVLLGRFRGDKNAIKANLQSMLSRL